MRTRNRTSINLNKQADAIHFPSSVHKHGGYIHLVGLGCQAPSQFMLYVNTWSNKYKFPHISDQQQLPFVMGLNWSPLYSYSSTVLAISRVSIILQKITPEWWNILNQDIIINYIQACWKDSWCSSTVRLLSSIIVSTQIWTEGSSVVLYTKTLSILAQEYVHGDWSWATSFHPVIYKNTIMQCSP